MSRYLKKIVSIFLIISILIITTSAVNAIELNTSNSIDNENIIELENNYANMEKFEGIQNSTHNLKNTQTTNNSLVYVTINNESIINFEFTTNSAGDNGGCVLVSGLFNNSGHAYSSTTSNLGIYNNINGNSFSNTTKHNGENLKYPLAESSQIPQIVGNFISGTTTIKNKNNIWNININTNINSHLNSIKSPKMNLNVDTSLKNSDKYNIDFKCLSYGNNTHSNTTENIFFGLTGHLDLLNYKLEFNISIDYSYSNIKSHDTNIIDSSFLNNANYSTYKIIYEDENSNYIFFDSDFLNTIICNNATTEIINTAVTVYESNFARNSLLRITNESVIGNYSIGFIDFSNNCTTKNETYIYSISVSITGYEILSESFAISNSYKQSNIDLTTDICQYTVKDCLIISKNNIEYNMTINDSLVILENLK